MDLEKVKKLIKPRLNELGYDLYSLKSRKEKGELILEVIVDRLEKINLNDIVEVTNEINLILDENDPIEESYVLDVSSLGAEKPLKVEKLKDYVGQYVHLHMINPVDGINIIEGNLVDVNEDELTLSYKIKTREKTITTKLTNIYQIRLAIKF